MSAAVAKKILAASKAIGHIEKDGDNTHFKYKFQAWDDVLPAVRNACAAVGLAIVPSAELIEVVNDKSLVRMTLLFIDSETGETLTANWVGEGKDGQDKGIQKAITSAFKYALLKALMIPCSDDADPDSDGPAKAAPKTKAEPKASTAKPNASVAAQAPGEDRESKEREAMDLGKAAMDAYRLTPVQIKQFEDECAAKGFKWYVQAVKADKEGIRTFTDLMQYVADKEPAGAKS